MNKNIIFPGITINENIISTNLINTIILKYKSEKNEEYLQKGNNIIYWSGVSKNSDNKQIDQNLFEIFNQNLKKYLKIYDHYFNNIKDSGYSLINLKKSFNPVWVNENFVNTVITAILFIDNIEDSTLELNFKFINKKVEIKSGSLIIFPSNFVYTYNTNNKKHEKLFIITNITSN